MSVYRIQCNAVIHNMNKTPFPSRDSYTNIIENQKYLIETFLIKVNLIEMKSNDGNRFVTVKTDWTIGIITN